MWFLRSVDQTASKEALQESIETLKQTNDREPDVFWVSQSFRVIRERNHFAEELQKILGGSN